MPLFAPVVYGLQRLTRGSRMMRHRHDEAYAAVVLEGEYDEAGDCGRFRAKPGDVLFHGRFEAHANWIGGRGALVLNVPLAADGDRAAPARRLVDTDQVVRAAQREGLGQASALLEEAPPNVDAACDWPDVLAAAIAANPSLRLDAWSDQRNLAPATVSRGFGQAYGVSPSRFRLEIRARRAWCHLARSELPLAEVALLSGFADQAHMTRAIRAITGRSPGEWRAKRQMRSRRDAPVVA
ncbi:MAG TPA: AraC family transcriptional regulator [Opitutaceae bacterium]